MDFFRVFSPTGPLAIQTRERPDYTDDEDVTTRRRQAWHDLRDEILPPFITEHPGTRPVAWWEFDAPERRRCVSGPHPYDNRDNRELWGPPKFWYGKPSCWRSLEDSKARYESQLDFLERLGLLVLEELALMPIELPGGTH